MPLTYLDVKVNCSPPADPPCILAAPLAAPVDESYFFDALEVNAAAEIHKPIADVVTLPNSHGLRACAFALFSMARNLENDTEGENAFARIAHESIDSSLSLCERPSQHTVSALVLLDLAKMIAGQEFGTCAGLALSLASSVPGIHPEILYCSAVFYKQSLFARHGATWPSPLPPIGTTSL